MVTCEDMWRVKCLGWTWYLSNDMQFSIVLAPIFISLTAWNQTCGLLFGVLLVISAAVTYGVLCYTHGYGLFPMDPTWFSVVYAPPYTRWGTYAIGMLLGWILITYPTLPLKRTIRNLILVPLVGITISTTLCMLVIYGPFGVTSGRLPPMDKVTESTYLGIQRPTFAIGLAITVYLCATRWAEPIRMILAWSAFRIPARLTYGAYMFHIVLIYYTLLGTKTPVSIGNFFWIQGFFSVLCLTYLSSFLLSMVSEAPIYALERLIRGDRK